MGLTRAQGNTFWIIIFAVLALLVLVVLVVIFTKTTSTVQEGILSCTSKQGQCVNEGQSCPDTHPIESSVFTCQNENERCCLNA